MKTVQLPPMTSIYLAWAKLDRCSRYVHGCTQRTQQCLQVSPVFWDSEVKEILKYKNKLPSTPGSHKCNCSSCRDQNINTVKICLQGCETVGNGKYLVVKINSNWPEYSSYLYALSTQGRLTEHTHSHQGGAQHKSSVGNTAAPPQVITWVYEMQLFSRLSTETVSELPWADIGWQFLSWVM